MHDKQHLCTIDDVRLKDQVHSETLLLSFLKIFVLYYVFYSTNFHLRHSSAKKFPLREMELFAPETHIVCETRE